MNRNDSQAAEHFAVEVVRRLQEAGYQALFAGGCVRDHLLGKTPKDFDVATSARPEQVREVFGYRRTIPVGAAFGVITVIGPKTAGNVEIATFRCDGTYSDGRHPDQVTFSDAEHDALRRDFTINGLFYDPLQNRVLDFVGGQADLQAGVIRAIGVPAERFQEDHLRLLRAIRFATLLKFEIEPQTLAAVQQLASGLQTVSGERIAAEMYRLLGSEDRGRGLTLLHVAKLLTILMPWASSFADEDDAAFAGLCQQLSSKPITNYGAEVSVAALAIACTIARGPTTNWWQSQNWPQVHEHYRHRTQQLIERWRLSNQAKAVFQAVEKHLPVVLDSPSLPWSQLQPTVASPLIQPVLDVATCLAECGWASIASLQTCREKLEQPPTILDPPPLVTGDQLQTLGVPAGPQFGHLLREIRRQQLDGELADTAQAIAWVLQRQ